jgi:YgiT-type zinc finger domain-containing protein
MTYDNLTIYDVEHCILTGQITGREMDLVTPVWKYRVSGYTATHDTMAVIAKPSPNDHLVIITVYILSQGETMECSVCGIPGVRVRSTTRSYGEGATLLVIENVPVISCPHCGESYLTAETLHALEELRRHRDRYASLRPVEVALFTNEV